MLTSVLLACLGPGQGLGPAGKGLHLWAQRPPAAGPPIALAQASVPAFHLAGGYIG